MFETLTGATRLVPVVGDPIAQVKSPGGVSSAFSQKGADVICVPMQIAPADWLTFIAAMRAMKNVDGIIVTVPHKFAAHDACDLLSERARFLKSVNTIRRLSDGRLFGDMFDGLGYVAAARENGCVFEGKRALLVGAGGAGTAIAQSVAAAGVASLGIVDTDVNRRDDLINRLNAAGFKVHAGDLARVADYGLLFNATPLGMREGDPFPFPVDALHPGVFVGDVVTKPELPALIMAARAAGCKTSNGVAMFGKVRDLMVDFLLDPTLPAGSGKAA